MGNNLREKALIASVVVVVLYALAVGVWFLSAQSSWKKAAKNYAKAKETYQKECRLIQQKRQWVEAYETEKQAMPTFKAGEATDTVWGRKLGEMMRHNLVEFNERINGKEIEAGEVLELPFKITKVEASLQAMVNLMFEFENTTNGMFDVTELSLRPSKTKKGYLNGEFTLNCAYMRE